MHIYQKSLLYQKSADISFQLITLSRILEGAWAFLTAKSQYQKSKQKFSEKSWAASVPIPTFMFLWAKIYIFARLVCLFRCRKLGGKYIDRSPPHDCENWDWGLFSGYINRNFFAVLSSEGRMKNPPNFDLRVPFMMFPLSSVL
jgi:hypothetical protein